MAETVLKEQPAVATHWQAYQPGPSAPWNLQRVVHLHRRCGFAANWREIQRDLQDAPQAAINRVLEGTAHQSSYPGDFEQMSELIADAALESNQPGRLKAWWAFRMLFTTTPLTEKLTLLWHNHFATSNQKVDDLTLMMQQNELFRRQARDRFGNLLTSVVKDPALLIWLDAPANHKGHPNENLARELMELFTLGIGHYSERDVKQAARALTGWTVRDDAFAFEATDHAEGQKIVLQQQVRQGDDLLALLLTQAATARRIAWRLCTLFLGEGVAERPQIESLAAGLQQHDLDLDWAVRTIVQSDLFFSDRNIRRRIADPAELMIGAARALERTDPPPQTLLIADSMRRAGLDLFYPPNVGGWNGGRSWLRTSAVISRTNFAASLARGTLGSSVASPDWMRFAAANGQDTTPEGFTAFLADLFLGGEPRPGWIDGIVKAAFNRESAPQGNHERIVALVLASPEAQLN